MTRSEVLFEQAKKTIPGGVNSPVRAFNGVGGSPLFIEKADGAYIFDADGKKYIDYVGSWGPMILGHNHPDILDAAIKAARNGLSFGTPTEVEIEMAELNEISKFFRHVVKNSSHDGHRFRLIFEIHKLICYLVFIRSIFFQFPHLILLISLL
mgnify:CR=1 FL=1